MKPHNLIYFLCIFLRHVYVVASNLDSDDFQEFKENNFLSISKIAVSMTNAAILTSSSPIKDKLTDLTIKIETTEKDIEMAEKDSRGKHLVGNIGVILNGLGLLAKGIYTGSSQDVVLGGLDIAVPLSSMAEESDPLTLSVLSLVSSIFDVFDGSTGGDISTESMVKGIINNALEQTNSRDLDLDVAKTKRLYSSLSTNIMQLREGGNVNKDQATEFFNQAFEEMSIFGKLDELISTTCAIGDITMYEDTKLYEAADKCLEFINLYCSLSVLRQLLITDMASLVADAGLNVTSTYLLKLIRKKQEMNKHMLVFMVDPINYRNERFIVSHFYGSPSRWPIVQAYLYLLDIISDGKYLRAHTVVCTKQQLQGDCYQMKIGNFNENDLMAWKNAISSLYIGANLQVTGYEEDKFKGKALASYIGPTVVGTVAGRNEWSSLAIEPTKKDSRQFMRFCENNAMRQRGLCDALPMGDYPRLEDLQSTDWSKRINSISIPANMQVTAWDQNNYKGNKFGPYNGPDVIDHICHKGEWKSLKLEKGLTHPSQMVKVCREEDFAGYCDYLEEQHLPELTNIHGCTWDENDKKIKSMKIPASFRVYLWTDKNYKGLEVGPYSGPALIPLVDGSEAHFVIRSMKIKRLY